MPSDKSGSQQQQPGARDFLFELLVGQPRMDLMNQVINNPDNKYAKAYPYELDKQEHAVASEEVAKRWGPMISFLTGVGQEAGTGLITGAKAAAQKVLPATKDAKSPEVLGPQGFDFADLLANMYGIQNAMGAGAPSFGEALLQRLQQFGQSFGGRRGPGERTQPGAQTWIKG